MKKKIALLVCFTAITLLSFAQEKNKTVPIPNACSKFSIFGFDSVSIIPSTKNVVVIRYNKGFHDSISASVIKDSMNLALEREIKDNNAEKIKGSRPYAFVTIYLASNKESLHFYFSSQHNIFISPLKCDKLFLNFSSSLNANCDIGSVKAVFVKAVVSLNIRIIGKANYLSLSNEASSNIDLSKLIVDDALINNSVSSNVLVNVQKNMTLIRNKISRMKYIGNPELHYRVSDSVETKYGALEKY